MGAGIYLYNYPLGGQLTMFRQICLLPCDVVSTQESPVEECCICLESQISCCSIPPSLVLKGCGFKSLFFPWKQENFGQSQFLSNLSLNIFWKAVEVCLFMQVKIFVLSNRQNNRTLFIDTSFFPQNLKFILEKNKTPKLYFWRTS